MPHSPARPIYGDSTTHSFSRPTIERTRRSSSKYSLISSLSPDARPFLIPKSSAGREGSGLSVSLAGGRIPSTMSDLAARTCVPCRGGVSPLKGGELAALEAQVRTSPRHLACLGKSRDHDLDAQDQRSDGERFHLGSQNRPALQTLNSAPCVNHAHGRPGLPLFWSDPRSPLRRLQTSPAEG